MNYRERVSEQSRAQESRQVRVLQQSIPEGAKQSACGAECECAVMSGTERAAIPEATRGSINPNPNVVTASRGPSTRLRTNFEQAVLSTIMPLVASLGLGDYWRRYQDLLQADSLPSFVLQQRQWDGFKELLAHAYESVPLYRDTMKEAGIKPVDVTSRADLPMLPCLDKRTVVSAFPDLIASTVSNKEEWRYRSTSGTAYRVMSITDYSARQWRYALYLRSMKIAADYDVGMRQITIRTHACTENCSGATGGEHAGGSDAMYPVEEEWPPFGLSRITMQETNLPPLTGRGTLVSPQAIDNYLHQIALAEPYLLRGLPMYLLMLARRLRKSGAPPPCVKRIIVQDSLSPAELKQEIAEAFGCEVREIYGSSELGGIAAECGQGWLHVASDLFLVEVLNSDGTVAEPGVTGIIVISSLANWAMPLIRYRIGDVGQLVPGECLCGRNTPRIRVDGRIQESLIGESGIITARQISRVVYTFPGVGYFKLVEHRPGHINLFIVPSDTVPLNAARLCTIVQRLVGTKRTVKLRLIENISPEESGKFMFVTAFSRDYHPAEG